MGDEGRIPPSLNGVGAKLTAGWLKKIFAEGSNDRPYMLTRHTLEDRRLSRGDKRALKEVLAEAISSDRDMAVYRSAAFGVARRSFNDPSAREVLDWLEDVVKLLQCPSLHQPTRAESHFSPGDDCPTRIGGLFSAARKSADVCVFTITDDRISDAILESHRRGILVRIITDNEKAFDPGSDISRFERAGIGVRIDQSPYHMHHKFAIFDEELLLTGSYNWTRGAAENNEENFVLTGERRLLEPFRELFERLWKQFG
jgi:phosphatidylserine/phosphatidylglycerophosphate/cardiolipin synthase-like enzyme